MPTQSKAERTAQAIAILADCAAVIDKSNWTRCTMARDKYENPICSDSKTAVTFCALGHIDRATYKLKASYAAAEEAQEMVRRVLPDGDITMFNDKSGRTPAQVRALFQKALHEAVCRAPSK